MTAAGFKPREPLASPPRRDVAEVLEALANLRQQPTAELRDLFDGCERLVLTRAPC